MFRMMRIVKGLALLAVAFPLVGGAGPAAKMTGRPTNSTIRIDVVETAAPADRVGADGLVNVCVNGNWTGTCDYVLQGQPHAVHVPLRGTLRIEHEAYVFDDAEIESLKTGGAKAGGGGTLQLKLAAPAEGCAVASDGATLEAEISSFWDGVQPPSADGDGKTLTWDLTGAKAVAFQPVGCPQFQGAAQLKLLLRLPLKHTNGSMISQPMTLSSVPGEGYLLPPLTVSNKVQPGASLDFVFVIDTTGSMWDDIGAVKSSAIELVNSLYTDSPDARVAVMDYKDYPAWPGSTDFPFRVASDFTNNQAQVVGAIQSLSAGGGGDFPESVYTGLMAALAPRADHLGKALSPWRTDARKVLLVFGDAPAHDPEPVSGYTLQTVTDAAAALGAGPPGLPSLTSLGVSSAGASSTGAVIYTLLIGNSASARTSFEALANGTGGQSFTAANANMVVPVLREALGTIGEAPAPVNQAPFTLWAMPSIDKLDTPNQRMVDIDILNVLDPEGAPVTVEVTAITQDEQVSTGGKALADGAGVGTSRASVRAERSGKGNSRVYRIWFVARDAQGAESTGSVLVCVPHDQGVNVACQDDGQLYDSTVP